MKISIPKEIIDNLVVEYKCTEEEAAKAYLDAQDRASETFKEEVELALGKSGESADFRTLKIFTPKEIKEHLDKFVIGQEEYKKRLSIATAFHFAMVKYLHQNPDQKQVIRFRKKNTITAGPTGSGKTYCIEVLGDLLKVPILTVDATDYTEAGYVGKSADDMVRELIDLAPGESRKEQAGYVSRFGGMIFIDEIDKKAKEGNLVGHDISREGFQRAVLKLIERKQIPIDSPYSPAVQIQEAMSKDKKSGSKKQVNMISTENILFILGGSFERNVNSLDDIVKKRLTRGTNYSDDGESFVIRGFSPESNNPADKQLKNYYKNAASEDFIKFGLLPEIVGRSPIQTFVNPLSKNNLIRIMQETEDSILTQYELEFQLFDVTVEFKEEAIEHVAETAEMMRTGARALVSVWENILTDFQFELPGTHFKELTVDLRLCEKPEDVLLEMMEKSPFLHFIETFRMEHGVHLVMDDDVQDYVIERAKEKNAQVSETLKNMLFGATALGFMNIKGPFQIKKKMLTDKKHFDKLFTEWYNEHQPETKEKL